eukprot:IDg9802t1
MRAFARIPFTPLTLFAAFLRASLRQNCTMSSHTASSSTWPASPHIRINFPNTERRKKLYNHPLLALNDSAVRLYFERSCSAFARINAPITGRRSERARLINLSTSASSS